MDQVFYIALTIIQLVVLVPVLLMLPSLYRRAERKEWDR